MSPTRPSRSRRTIQWPVVIWLDLVWILLWGSIDPVIVVGGFLVALIVLTAFPLPPMTFDGRVRPLKFMVLCGRFGFDLVRSSIEVAWLTIRPAKPPMNSLIEVDLLSPSELYLTITSELLSLVPGSLLIEVARTQGRIYLHILGAEDSAAAERARAAAFAQERRVIEALASDAELAAYHLMAGERI